LNLVAKEGMLVNQHDGVLVLSEHAGVHAELGAFSLSVHPFDIEAQADALWRAIGMDRVERRARREACVDVIRSNDIRKWLQAQVIDIADLRERPATAVIDLAGPETGTPPPVGPASLGQEAKT